MRIYISGKITGRPIEEAMHHFQAAEDFLKEKYKDYGVIPVNPFKLDHIEAKNLHLRKELNEPSITEHNIWSAYMAEDIKALLNCDGIYMLKGCGESKGAKLEYVIAVDLRLTIQFEE